MTIWKFPLRIASVQAVEMPEGANVMSVGLDPSGDLCAWAFVDPKAEKVLRTFYVVGTGAQAGLESRQLYLGTVTKPPFVWHVFSGFESEDAA